LDCPSVLGFLRDEGHGQASKTSQERWLRVAYVAHIYPPSPAAASRTHAQKKGAPTDAPPAGADYRLITNAAYLTTAATKVFPYAAPRGQEQEQRGRSPLRSMMLQISPAAYEAMRSNFLDLVDTPRRGPDGLIKIWLDPKFVDRLGQMRRAGESYSDVILRLAKQAEGAD
jgi:hypothetical protein